MSTAGVSNPIYVPYVWVNPATEKAELGTYSYAALMEQFQKKMEEAAGKPLEIGDQRLSEAEIQELANRYDPQNMTQDEYDGFIRYLQEKGVLSQLETSDLGMSRITIVPGYFEPAYIWTSSSGVGSSVRTLGDVGGNALQFAQIMTQWAVPGSSLQIRKDAYSKVLEILNQMNAVRGSGMGGQGFLGAENGPMASLSTVMTDEKWESLSQRYDPSGMTRQEYGALLGELHHMGLLSDGDLELLSVCEDGHASCVNTGGVHLSPVSPELLNGHCVTSLTNGSEFPAGQPVGFASGRAYCNVIALSAWEETFRYYDQERGAWIPTRRAQAFQRLDHILRAMESCK